MTMPTGLQILIADDDDADRKLIRRTLKQADFAFETVEVATIADALAACDRQGFDLAFVDYLMPGQDGLDGIKALHRRRLDMAIIMITGQGDEFVASEAIKAGALDYIPKRAIGEASLRRVIANALEKQALQRKIAEQQEELANFAKVLVHDLKAPLRAIGFFAAEIKEAVDTDDRATIAEDCRHLTDATDRIDQMFRTLLHYTEVDAKAEFGPVSLTAVLDHARLNLHTIIAERRAEITHGPLSDVIGNDVLLIQLLQNLIANGIKYCEAPVPQIRVTAETTDDAWQIAVTDNGSVIPQAQRDQVFQPFKRLHGNDHYAGTGLGLATCKKIVTRHGGEIWCDEAPGHGTVFYFTLPIG
jgi:signal transduction histidine kinase